MKKYSEKIFLELGCYTEDDIGQERFDKLIKNSQPTEEKFIRVSSIVSLPDIFYNFKLRTKSKTAYFCICSALGNTDKLWNFLELVTLGKYNILYYESPQEGPNSTLRVEKIDEENIRFTLVSNKWLEHFWNLEKRTAQVNWANFPNGGYNVNLDIIINKKEFIYAFWLELFEIFNGDGYVDTIPEAGSADIARTDSEIIRKYLGYVPGKKIDEDLQKAIKNNNKDKIVSLLKTGANPNAIINEYQQTIFEDFLQNYCENIYEEEYRKRCSDEKSDAIEEKMADFRDNLGKDFFDIVKLMVKHGAKTTCLFPAIYNFNRDIEIITYLLDHNCVFDTDTVGFVSTDSQILGIEDKYYKKLKKMFSKYLFSCSYKLDSEADIIFHDPPEYYYWQHKVYKTQKDWILNNGESWLNK